RIVPHAHAAELMDDRAARRDAITLLARRHRVERLATHFGDERPERLLHVLHLPVFVHGPLPMEAEDRDAPAIHRAGVDLAVAVVVGNHLPPPREPDVGAVVAAVVVLELFAVAAAGRVAVDAAQES